MDKGEAPHSWRHFSDPAFAFEFDYPASTTTGSPVTLQRYAVDRDERVHVSDLDGRWVYFELDRAAERYGEAGVAALEGDVRGRFHDAWFGNPAYTQLCGLPALSIHFRFNGRVRWAIFTMQSAPSYRVILDPRSATNLAILGTLVLRSGSAD